ncbi:LacI family DNA-binding transcriptional regulator [Dyella flagellata]|uniref:LacI family transcriptional regulator n=1 Tax=Dyella flagellata TaxID=1867833 RepID=A0ABQ5X5I2_9GAMM|nr:LacI family DNA-binding transcriptional regulator [Dyella flagellata]GLQ86861.1 LacI family transcriptional regulator [Dyella flagellata]
MTTKNATIKDVAREAKVSVASVSRVLNGLGGVTPVTQKIVREVAARLNYVPDNAARSLITGRTHTIGAVLPDLHGEFFSELIRGIELAARAQGLHLLLSSTHDGIEDAAAAMRAMRGRVDGMLILSEHVDAAFLEENLPDKLPAVLLDSPVKSARYPVLNIDNRAGAIAMVGHLIEAGHQQVAFIGGPKTNYNAQQREKGYRTAMARHAPDAPLTLFDGNFSEESGYRAGQQMLAKKPRPQAVFAANDMMAIGCLRAFREAGLAVPGDIALAGFDDILVSRYLTPPLSTVQVRIADLGRLALERLAALLNRTDKTPASVQTLGCDIVIRESCGGKAAAGAASRKLRKPPRPSRS